MKKKLLLICLCSLCIAVGTTAQIDITVKADIVSDGGSDSIGGETAGDNDGVIVGDGEQQPDQQPAPQPVPVQPQQEAEIPAEKPPVKSSQSKKEPEKTIEPQKTENPASPEESEKSAETAPSKEPKKTENPAPSKEPDEIENPAPSEKAEETKTIDTADQKEMQKPAETIPSKEPVKEKTPAISLKIIKMLGALIIGYIVAAVIVLGFRTVMSPLVFYMSIDIRYRFAAPVRLKKASEGYQIDITKIIDRYDSSTFQIRFNRMALKKLQGMELTIINGEQRIASDIRSSIDVSI